MSTLDWSLLNLLVVEDEKDLRDLIALLFRKKGCQVFTAGNGHEGFSIVQSEKIDLVISDVRMPEEDGVQMLKKIRARDPDLPIVFLATGFADIDRKTAKELGAADLIHKPFRISALMEAIETVLMASRKIGVAS